MTISTDDARVTNYGLETPTQQRPWRPAFTTWLLAVIVLAGVGAALFPSTAQWLTSYNQSKITRNYSQQIADSGPKAGRQLAIAKRCNDAVNSGVDYLAGASFPIGTGISSHEQLEYENILTADDQGLMARIKFPAAQVDLPIYHGTSDETLMEGAGHLEGTHLPIGGENSHSVITAHRGLATATMFNHLDQAAEGDRFTIEVFGEVLTYEVREITVIAPEETDSLRVQPGRDLVTLITCTPIGINSHRIIVTGERVTPTPTTEIAATGEPSDTPGFPWWALGAGAAIALAAGFVWRTGYSDARLAARKAAAN